MRFNIHPTPQKSLSTFCLLLSISLVSIFTFVYLSGHCHAADRLNIRVCVSREKSKLLLSVKGSYRIEDMNSGLVLNKGRYLKREFIISTNSGLRLGNREFKIYGIKIIPAKDATIFVNKRRLRGIVSIIRTEKLKLLVVNHLDIEKYLYGVLYHEVPSYWPQEALKAQAIAARTFALYRMEKMRQRDYDLTSDIYSQVYGGRGSERRRTTRAVDATRDKILAYNGKTLPAYYHAMCGGHTEDAKVVFDIDLPPLKGRSCPYCKGAPHMRWKAMFSYKQMEERLNKYGIEVKRLNYIIEGRRDRAGRLENVRIRDSKGVKAVKGYEFRLALGPNMIKSTNFTIRITPKGVIFRGKGWGHGIGLCQWGAFGMAKHHFNYKRILEYYYPGAKITKIRDL